MSDVVYRATDGLPAAKAAAAPPPPPPPEAPDDGPPPPDVTKKYLTGPELSIDDLGKKRKDDPESGRIEDLHTRPIVPLRYLDKQQKTLKQASHDVSAYHAKERGAELLGNSAPQFDAATQREIGELLNPATVPPTKIGLRAGGPDGNGLDVANAVDSPWPLMAADEVPNARLATKMVGDWREARAREQEALRAQIEEQQVAQAEEQERQVQEQQAAQQRQAEEAQRAAEQRQAEADRQRALQAQEIARLSNEERAAAHELAQLAVWAEQAPLDEKEKWLPEAKRRVVELQNVLKDKSVVRHAHESRAVQEHQARVDAWSKNQDNEFWRQLEQRHPYFAKDPVGMHKAVNAYIKSQGWDQAALEREWKSGGTMRSAGAQIVLADAVAHWAARENMKNIASKRAPIPPVQRPGMARDRGADSGADIAAIERAIASAPTAQQQLKLAQKLTKARRAAGLL